jgi:hypothetical protein
LKRGNLLLFGEIKRARGNLARQDNSRGTYIYAIIFFEKYKSSKQQVSKLTAKKYMLLQATSQQTN